MRCLHRGHQRQSQVGADSDWPELGPSDALATALLRRHFYCGYLPRQSVRLSARRPSDCESASGSQLKKAQWQPSNKTSTSTRCSRSSLRRRRMRFCLAPTFGIWPVYRDWVFLPFEHRMGPTESEARSSSMACLLRACLAVSSRHSSKKPVRAREADATKALPSGRPGMLISSVRVASSWGASP